jgi:16S rRNA (adenine1518-N6/adenine1519-N6)-dimethyltransferase
MLQKEVVDRMVSPAGGGQYGRLSVMLQYRFRMQRLFDVAAGSFNPPPKVRSAVVRMIPLEPEACLRAKDEGLLGRLVAQAFSRRRKTLRNALEGYLDQAGDGGCRGLRACRRHSPQAAARRWMNSIL